MAERLTKILVWMLDFKFSINMVLPFVVSLVFASMLAFSISDFSEITLGNPFYVYVLGTILVSQLFFIWWCFQRSRGFFNLGYAGLLLGVIFPDVFFFVAVFISTMMVVKVVFDYYVNKPMKEGVRK